MLGDKYSYIWLIIKFFGPIFLLAFILYPKIIIKYWKVILKAALFGTIGYFIFEPPALIIKAWGFGATKTITDQLLPFCQPETFIWSILLCSFVCIAIMVASDKEEAKNSIFIPGFLIKKIKN